MRIANQSITALAMMTLALIGTAIATGCKTDEVRTEQRIEIHEESEPQMVSPGEMVVE